MALCEYFYEFIIKYISRSYQISKLKISKWRGDPRNISSQFTIKKQDIKSIHVYVKSDLNIHRLIIIIILIITSIIIIIITIIIISTIIIVIIITIIIITIDII